MAVRLFVGNLPYDTSESEIREFFAQIGPLSFVSLPVDRETGKLRGFAFVEYPDRNDAESAIRRFDGQSFKGRRLAVNEAREREKGPGLGAPRRPAAPRIDSGPGPTPTPPAPFPKGGAGFGPDAPPKRARKKPKKGGDMERRPKKPIPEITRGQYFGGDEQDSDDQFQDDLFEDNFASRLGGDEDEEDI